MFPVKRFSTSANSQSNPQLKCAILTHFFPRLINEAISVSFCVSLLSSQNENLAGEDSGGGYCEIQIGNPNPLTARTRPSDPCLVWLSNYINISFHPNRCLVNFTSEIRLGETWLEFSLPQVSSPSCVPATRENSRRNLNARAKLGVEVSPRDLFDGSGELGVKLSNCTVCSAETEFRLAFRSAFVPS